MKLVDTSHVLRGARIVAIAVVFLGGLMELQPAFATDEIFKSGSPIDTFIEFITGIFAYMLLIVGLVITLGGLVLGSDMSGFARRAPLVVVAGAVLILADTVVGNLFSGSKGAEWRPVQVPAQVQAHIPARIQVQEQVVGRIERHRIDSPVESHTHGHVEKRSPQSLSESGIERLTGG